MLRIKNWLLTLPLVLNWVVKFFSPSPTFNVGWRWTIRSGAAYTPIVGVQENPWFDNSVLPVYGDLNSDRLPALNRLDIKFKWYRTLFGKNVEYTIDIVNALNNRNVTERTLDYDIVKSVDDPVAIEERRSNGILPALGMRLYLE